MKRTLIYKTVTILLFCILQLAVFAQGSTISGTVKDAAGNPMPGVSILIKGSIQGTTTSIDGKFTISAKDENSILVFSFIGYANTEVPVGTQTVIDVVLKENITQLDEIVVTGYGVSKKSDLTGSITSLKDGNFNKGAVTSPEQMMQGRVAGVQITSNNGEPGAGSQIRVR